MLRSLQHGSYRQLALVRRSYSASSGLNTVATEEPRDTAADDDLSDLPTPPVWLHLPASKPAQRGIARELRRLLRRGADGRDGSLPSAQADPGCNDGGWQLVDGGRVLERAWTFRRFHNAWSFLNNVIAHFKGTNHPPPTIVLNNTFVLLRWTAHAVSSPTGLDRSSSPTIATSASDPARESDATAALGLTRTTVSLAAATSALALAHAPVGVGSENAAWWAQGGQAAVTEAAQRLLAVGRATQASERARWGSSHTAYLTATPGAAGRAGEQTSEMAQAPGATTEDTATATMTTTTTTTTADGADAGADVDAASRLQPAHGGADIDGAGDWERARAARRDALVGRNWVGLAQLEEQRRARAGRREGRAIRMQRRRDGQEKPTGE